MWPRRPLPPNPHVLTLPFSVHAMEWNVPVMVRGVMVYSVMYGVWYSMVYRGCVCRCFEGVYGVFKGVLGRIHMVYIHVYNG